MTENKTSIDYWKTQNKKRLNVGISRSLIGQLRGIRNYTGFTNDDQTVEYLLKIEKGVRKQNLIKEVKICEKCGVPIDVKLDDYTGIIHQHVDAQSNCFGHITTEYRIKMELNDTTESNDKPIKQTYTNDENSETNDKKEREIDQLGYRNGIRITDMDDPNYDNKFFDIDLPNLKKKLEEEKKLYPTTVG